MNLLKDICKTLYEYGTKDENYLIPLSQVWVNYGLTDINLYIKESICYIRFPLGYEYAVSELTSLEQYSIWENLSKFKEEYKKMLNSKTTFEIDY